jgi:hypothetical protein
MSRSSKRTGVLVVRIWLENDPEAPLRARVSRSLDLDTAPVEELTVASAEEVAELVRDWLEAFLR